MNNDEEYSIHGNQPSTPPPPSPAKDKLVIQPLPQKEEANTQSQQKAAADLARAKLQALFESEEPSPMHTPEPVHAPRVEQEYQQIQTLQQQIDHAPVPPARIDHQLMDDSSHYELPQQSSFVRDHEWAPLLWVKSKIPRGFHPPLRFIIFFALIFSLYNSQIILGQVQYYVSPGTGSNPTFIVDPSTDNKVGPEPKLIIPKINVEVPVVYGVTTYDPDAYRIPLREGVVHYGTTALPGENGNNALLGHSSNAYFENGKYKFAFVQLNKLVNGDTFIINYEGKRYIYEVFLVREVQPTEISEAVKDFGEPVTTLITCTPVGTNLRRLLVHARQVSPDPEKATEFEQSGDLPEAIVPSNAPSGFDKIREWLF